jgi:periplasmic protein TonB
MTATVSNCSWHDDADSRRSALGRFKAALLKVESEAVSFFRLTLAMFVSMVVHLGVLQWKDADHPVIEPAIDRERMRIALPVVNRSRAEKFSSRVARSALASKTQAPALPRAVSPGSKRIPKPTRRRQSIPVRAGKAKKRQPIQAARKKFQSVRRSQPTDAVAGAEQAKSAPAAEGAPVRKQTRPKLTPMEEQSRNSNAIAHNGHGSPKAAALSGSRHSLRLLIRHPRFRRPPRPPVYPRQAIRRGQEGTTTIHAKISSEGTVQQIKLFRSSGVSSLDQAAMAAVRKWEFEPATRKGLSVDAWVEVPVNFVLKQSSRGWP